MGGLREVAAAVLVLAVRARDNLRGPSAHGRLFDADKGVRNTPPALVRPEVSGCAP